MSVFGNVFHCYIFWSSPLARKQMMAITWNKKFCSKKTSGNNDIGNRNQATEKNPSEPCTEIPIASDPAA